MSTSALRCSVTGLKDTQYSMSWVEEETFRGCGRASVARRAAIRAALKRCMTSAANKEWQRGRALGRCARRQSPRTLSELRYAMEGILSAIFIQLNHHCALAFTNGECQTCGTLPQGKGINLTPNERKQPQPEELHSAFEALYTPKENRKSKNFSPYIIVCDISYHVRH
jgi:hypothetical protein